MKLKLYHYWRSSCSWRVRWALELKGLSYEAIAVDLLKQEEQAAEYKTLNPSGYVPCLIAGEQNLGESLAIIEWLDENYEGATLVPSDSFARAKARQLAETINAGTQPIQNLAVMKKVSADKEEQFAWNKYWIERGFTVYEDILREIGMQGNYSMGDEALLPDLCLIPQVYNAKRFNVELSKFPVIAKIYDYAMATKECQRSAPDSFQP